MRTALVTGGRSGLGAACARRLTEDGLQVVTLDVAPEADHTVDVTDRDQVQAAAAQIGSVDVLINSAGIVGPNQPLLDTEPQQWAQTFEVNVTGVLNVLQAFVPGMVEAGWGRVVNFASMAGKDGNPNLSAYSASKAAVIGLTKSLGKELATTGVLVNAVAPAVFETPMNAETSPEVLQRLTSLIPMHRLGRPEEAAALVSWLASEECSFSTGSVYDLSGGRATY
ncbi:SDR family oxidoreductase [Nocardioides rotundus]|uniref:SDR family NAD(P)-dependent oxidoreductase n=1 Tax=Nocardioides rotundus TaxID=1774216 RepID=UPI001CBFA595|nr:SDR family NAD(P)-dependent oxidoreductase [Nocardioides rotundus]UAL31423.1 SDR family oxidoreductase [Nocardioides rotundus]